MKRLLFILLFFICRDLSAQAPHFRKITNADGLNDAAIESFGQDKYGYIWIGTSSGLNRYDGYRVKQYINMAGDSNTVYPGHVWDIVKGPDGNMYFSLDGGIVRFNYDRNNFTRIKAGRQFGVGNMVMRGKEILLASTVGLVFYNPFNGRFRFFSDQTRDTAQGLLAERGLLEIELLNDGRVLATSGIGLLLIDPDNGSVRQIRFPGLNSQSFHNVEVARNGTVWLSMINEPKLVRTDLSFRNVAVYDYLFPERKVVNNAISALLVDRNDDLWVTTVPDGLCLYNKTNDNFTRFINDPFQPSSLKANHLTAIYQDRSGLIWTGTGGGYGVHYFNPDKNLFQTILPRGNATTAGGWMWSRAASEDEAGKLWLATLDGVVQYDLGSGVIRSIKNEENKPPQLYSNSVRGILCDNEHVWICTGQGVNRYHRPTGKMEFPDGQDSLPIGFYFTVFKDSRNNLWIGGRDHDGLFLKAPGKGFTGIRHHPVLNRIGGYGVRSIFEDSKGRVWFGLNGSGLALYDPQLQTLKHWRFKEGDSTSLVGDLVTGIAEGKEGLIWISTTNGIASYNGQTEKFRSYNSANGLPAMRTSSIQVDGQNRVWAGSTQGLLMLQSSGHAWKLFDESDGLPTVQFADMPSTKLTNGRFLFPSLNGFVLFQPSDYTAEESPVPVYVSNFSVLNQPANRKISFEAATDMQLDSDENFFTIELTGLHYENPLQTWYAYKLEGFDKRWIYTKDRIINYTNVPGGSYRFLYKASVDPNNWNVAEKALTISISRVFYKTIYFWVLIALVLIFTLYSLYRFRMNKQRQILQLETKAKELEKEKTVVQYESLKQHLNPHFLFNSLTSLRSLIKTDVKTATGFLDGLSKVYRYVLRSGEKELSLVQDEIDFVTTFTSLQKTRFGEGLDVRINVAEASLDRYVVPVTLQNLLENAIKHNTADKESPLRITITSEDGYLLVQNNLQRYLLVETSNKQGLASLSNLYRFYTSKPVLVEEDEQFFTVKIPLL